MKKLLTVLFATASLNLFCQFANNWIIGNNVGINFNNTPPSTFTSGVCGNADNSSAISNAAGVLLFYTDGMTVRNATNAIMPNGSGLIGSFTAGQCALIVPVPCSKDKYVIFHNTEYSNPGYLNYTVVDMSLNGGLGDVVLGQKNISLGSGWTEKLCAYFKENLQLEFVPGERFNCPGFARITFAVPQEDLQEALKRLDSFLQNL